MNLVTEVTHSGEASTSTLAGDVRLEQGKGRLVVYDPITETQLQVLDIDGLKTYNGADGKEIVRVGRLPDGTYGFAVARNGHDISEAFS